jgi:hypothetical protein
VPIIEFVCSQDHRTAKLFLTCAESDDVNTIPCPQCLEQRRRRQAKRIPSAPATHFKGEGWTPVFYGPKETTLGGVTVKQGDDPNQIAKQIVKSHGAKALTQTVKGAK